MPHRPEAKESIYSGQLPFPPTSPVRIWLSYFPLDTSRIRVVERLHLLFASTDDGIQCELKELRFEVLANLPPVSCSEDKQDTRSCETRSTVTRTDCTGGKCVIHSEYSWYTVEGRIDFFIESRQWGIECVKDGDRRSNHENRFQGQGAYGLLGYYCLRLYHP